MNSIEKAALSVVLNVLKSYVIEPLISMLGHVVCWKMRVCVGVKIFVGAENSLCFPRLNLKCLSY